MAGKKGHSGRYPKTIENYRQECIMKAWRKLHYKLDLADKQAYDFSRDIAVKDMVSKERIDMDARISEGGKSSLLEYSRLSRLPKIENFAEIRDIRADTGQDKAIEASPGQDKAIEGESGQGTGADGNGGTVSEGDSSADSAPSGNGGAIPRVNGE